MSDNLESDVTSTIDAASELVRDLARLGATWMRHGLTVGESSMKQAARTIDEAALKLGQLADKLRGG